MVAILGLDAGIHFGGASDLPLSNWRRELKTEVDPDDEELDETPLDVVFILGFDPKELFRGQANNPSTG